MTWLGSYLACEAQWVSGTLYQGTQLAIAEMNLHHDLADMYFYSGDSIQAAIDAGMGTISFTPVLDFPNFAQNADSTFKLWTFTANTATSLWLM